jgi:sterol desaturase/sphingolipid hydroxylase (fatty acid hydroxylase superfamily)
MRSLLDRVTPLATRALHSWTSFQRLGGIAVIAAVVVCWAVAWRRRNGAWPRIKRDAVTDLVYWLFYTAGIFTILGFGKIFTVTQAAMHRWLPMLELNLLRDKPMWLQIAGLAVVCDFASYGWHRATHASSLLWLIHRAHHSSEQLNPLTNYRVHIVDFIGRGLVLIPPAALLGFPAQATLGVIWAQTALNTLAHADLGWSYGPLGFLFVSPRHHRLHHSEDAAVSQRNYGIFFSFWDYLFGTTAPNTARPERFGLAGDTVPPGFIAQQFEPLVVLWRRMRPEGASSLHEDRHLVPLAGGLGEDDVAAGGEGPGA